uniref:uncharacterized protein LOC118144768 isoform X2 n=1 Tax=Callithrix jacchus TaxID=9483 RepID=UPI00159EB0FC|nr:uncharacterized protein LOC118144768 isoform X2 [Callithrix jacchus]
MTERAQWTAGRRNPDFGLGARSQENRKNQRARNPCWRAVCCSLRCQTRGLARAGTGSVSPGLYLRGSAPRKKELQEPSRVLSGVFHRHLVAFPALAATHRQSLLPCHTLQPQAASHYGIKSRSGVPHSCLTCPYVETQRKTVLSTLLSTVRGSRYLICTKSILQPCSNESRLMKILGKIPTHLPIH